MGTVYYSKDRKKWRVQFRYGGFPSISMSFATYGEACIFHDKTDKIIVKKKEQRKVLEALNKLKEHK